MNQPFHGRHAQQVLKSATQGSGAHRSLFRDGLKGVWFFQVGVQPVEQWGEFRNSLSISTNKLGLAAFPGQRHDRTTCSVSRNRCAVIASNEMKTQVDACCCTSRGAREALVDVQHIGVNGDVWKGALEFLSRKPMRRRRLVVEQSSRGQNKSTGADGNNPNSFLSRPLQGTNEYGVNFRVDVGRAWNHNGVTVQKRAQSPPCSN